MGLPRGVDTGDVIGLDRFKCFLSIISHIDAEGKGVVQVFGGTPAWPARSARLAREPAHAYAYAHAQ